MEEHIKRIYLSDLIYINLFQNCSTNIQPSYNLSSASSQRERKTLGLHHNPDPLYVRDEQDCEALYCRMSAKGQMWKEGTRKVFHCAYAFLSFLLQEPL